MRKLWLIVLITVLAGCTTSVPEESKIIIEQFQNPPDEARPRVWWHWMNGNVTKRGIRKDLEWMHRIGVRGVHNFDANLATPEVVDNPLVFMSEDWKEAFRYTTELTDSLGFELTIAGSPGWSVTGGPWVEAADAMKKYVWTETRVEGGQTYNGQLPRPSATAGPFQGIAFNDEGGLSPIIGELPEYYSDARVIAFKLPDSDISLKDMNPKISTSGGADFDVEFLTDGNLHKTKYIEPGIVGEEFWIQYEFDEPRAFRAATVVGANHHPLEQFRGAPDNRRLLVSNDGVDFEEVTRITATISPQVTNSFKSRSGRFWRLSFETLPPAVNPYTAMMGMSSEDPKPEGVNLAEFVLHTTGRIDQFEDKAGFTPWKEDTPSFQEPAIDAISTSQVIDITNKMSMDGTLNWDVPEGSWIVLRLGYGLTGRQNHPASPAGTGLEVDKLDEEAVNRYINTYLDMYEEATGGLMGEEGLQSIILDSYEAGHMNWTHDFPEEFERRRGYSMVKWIPVLTGWIIESREASEKFLWDFRKTIGEMIVDNHYNEIGKELKKRNMKRYTESHEGNRIYLADGMDVKRFSDVPMSAMWTPGSLGGGSEEEIRSKADIREAASVAHIYGKPYVAAESMTSVGRPFQEHPGRLKRTADMELASGLNRFVIHTSVHQPLDDKVPGFTLGPFGQYFSRHETWADQSKAWIDYLSRSSFMLQQGDFVADILVYYGENTNVTRNFSQSLPAFNGYEYDFVNSTALLEAVTSENGRIITPGGGNYGVLVLHESAHEMTLPVLKKISKLVESGVHVTGQKPLRSPSLADDPDEFTRILNQIWADPNVSDRPAGSVLHDMGIGKDVEVSANSAEILYVHRYTDDYEIYWLNNRSAQENEATISFRVNGRKPMRWHPETGEISEVSWEFNENRTTVPLTFDPWEAYFIVFGESTSRKSYSIPEITMENVLSIEGPWRVTFQENRGAPDGAVFDRLISWTDHDETGIKYFSGTAIYKNEFRLADTNVEGRVLLSLGDVRNLAEVIVNGQNLGVLWKEPYEIDISKAVVIGDNSLEVRVTNVWNNRLVGDAQPGNGSRITFTAVPLVSSDQKLLPSGLLGPVKILSSK